MSCVTLKSCLSNYLTTSKVCLRWIPVCMYPCMFVCWSLKQTFSEAVVLTTDSVLSLCFSWLYFILADCDPSLSAPLASLHTAPQSVLWGWLLWSCLICHHLRTLPRVPGVSGAVSRAKRAKHCLRPMGAHKGPRMLKWGSRVAADEAGTRMGVWSCRTVMMSRLWLEGYVGGEHVEPEKRILGALWPNGRMGTRTRDKGQGALTPVIKVISIFKNQNECEKSQWTKFQIWLKTESVL